MYLSFLLRIDLVIALIVNTERRLRSHADLVFTLATALFLVSSIKLRLYDCLESFEVAFTYMELTAINAIFIKLGVWCVDAWPYCFTFWCCYYFTHFVLLLPVIGGFTNQPAEC